MVKMLELLKKQGCERTSLAVQKANYAVKMYEDGTINRMVMNTIHLGRC